MTFWKGWPLTLLVVVTAFGGGELWPRLALRHGVDSIVVHGLISCLWGLACAGVLILVLVRTRQRMIERIARRAGQGPPEQ